MNIMGRQFGEYISFIKGGLILIAVVWLVRLVLDLSGVSLSIAKFASVTVVALLLVIYFALKVHTHRFGGYEQLFVIYFLCALWLNFLIILAIIYADITGKENIYSIPEYSRGISHDKHILGHITAGTGLYTLFGFGVGSLILFLLRKLEKPHG